MKPETLTRLPETDEEVCEWLERADAQLTDILRGLYRCKRAQGASVLAAYEQTLRAHIEAVERVTATREEQQP